MIHAGMRCVVVAAHPAFADDIGRRVVVVRVEGNTVWTYRDEPPTYRTNARGRRVAATWPRAHLTCYGLDQLQPA